MFLASNFLFTSSDTFAVGCTVQPLNTWKKMNVRISAFQMLMLSELKTGGTVCRASTVSHCTSDESVVMYRLVVYQC